MCVMMASALWPAPIFLPPEILDRRLRYSPRLETTRLALFIFSSSNAVCQWRPLESSSANLSSWSGAASIYASIRSYVKIIYDCFTETFFTALSITFNYQRIFIFTNIRFDVIYDGNSMPCFSPVVCTFERVANFT